MNFVWEVDGPVSVPEVHNHLNCGPRQLSYSAAKAVLNNLHSKGHLHKVRLGRNTVFSAAMLKNDFERGIVASVLRSLKESFGKPVVAQLVDEFVTDEASLIQMERSIALKRQQLKPR